MTTITDKTNSPETIKLGDIPKGQWFYGNYPSLSSARRLYFKPNKNFKDIWDIICVSLPDGWDTQECRSVVYGYEPVNVEIIVSSA